MPSCKDCGLVYDHRFDEELHLAFCEARTCSDCGLVFDHALPVYGQSMIAGQPDHRLCGDCASRAKDERIQDH